MKKTQSELLYSSLSGLGSMRIAIQVTLTARMVRFYPPQESVTEVVPSRGTLKLPDRSPGRNSRRYLNQCLQLVPDIWPFDRFPDSGIKTA